MRPLRNAPPDETTMLDDVPRRTSGIMGPGELIPLMRELYEAGDLETALVLARRLASEVDESFPVTEKEEPLPPTERPSFGPWRGAPLASMQRDAVPRLLVAPNDFGKLPIDSRGMFVLTQIAGQTLQELLDVCPMTAAEAFAILEWLCAIEAIAIG